MSKFTIILNDLHYNCSNWRDELSGKDKLVTKSEYELTVEQIQAMALATYTVNKTKRLCVNFMICLMIVKQKYVKELRL